MLWLKVMKMQFGVCVWICYVFIVVSLTTNLSLGQNCGDFRMDGVTIPAGDITLREGQNLTIYCKLNDDYMAKPDHLNSSSLKFTSSKHILLNEMIDVINSSTIRLHIENMTESYTIYHCKWKITERVVCLNNVAVGTIPKPVLNFTCLSLNWENLTCTWKNPYNAIQTDYNLSYQLPGRASRGINFNCPEGYPEYIEHDTYRCVWNISTNPRYRQVFTKFNFTMAGSNILGNTTKVYNFNNFERIQFDGPRNLTFVSKTVNSILLIWDLQGNSKNFPPGLKYRIYYRSQYDENININGGDERNWKQHLYERAVFTDLEKQTEKILYNLTELQYAHAFYDIRVKVASAINTDELLWSPFSSVTVRTESTIPAYPPKVDIGSFEILYGVGNRDVYVYWQQIPEYDQNGENFNYSINVKENHTFNMSIKPNETTASYAKFTGLNFGNYEFSIYSANKIGKSKNYSKIIVPSKSENVAEPTSFTKIAFDNHTYELSWKEPAQRHNEIITSYTIFWCQNDKDRPYQCEGYLNWTKVSPDTRILNKTVLDNSIYQFAIAANTATSSSGMVWASCTIIYNKFVSKIKHVWVNNIGATYIEMAWKLDCSDRIGIVTGFRIFYCPIISPYNLSCNDSVQSNVTIEGDLNTVRGRVENLRPYTTYMLSVSVLTKSGEGYASDSKYNTTLEAAPDQIECVNITGYTNTTITLEWSLPKNMNGMFRYYLIKYNNWELKVENESTRNFTITNLTSFTTYSITVSACTNMCSVSSKEKTITTLIGYPTVTGEPKINYMNESQLRLYWAKPDIPGGYNLYQVKVEMLKTVDKTVDFYNTSDLEIELSIPSCNDHHGYEHIIVVRAINQAENGSLLVGPWSTSKTVPCSSLRTSYTIIYVFIILGALVIIVAFIVGGRKAWIRYQEMKNVEVALPPGLTHTIGSKMPEYSLTQRPVISPGLQTPGLKPIKEILPNETLNSIASDEQLLLEKTKRGHSGEVDSTLISGESSGCSSGNESISSSIASVPITNVACNVSDSGTEHALSADTASLESGSLRWRNVSNKPHNSESASSLRTDTVSRLPTVGQLWSKPYVTMPAPEKTDNYGGAWNKQTGPSGYCQVGVDSPSTTNSQPIESAVTPGYVQIPTLSSVDSKPKSASSSRGYVSYPKRPTEKLAISKPVFSSIQTLDPDDENTSVSQSDSDSSVNESPNVLSTGFKYSPIGSPMKSSGLISIEPKETEDEHKKPPDDTYLNHPTSSSYVKFGTEDTMRPGSTSYVKVGSEEITPVLLPYTKNSDVETSKKTTVPSSYVTLPQAIVRQPSQKSQSSAADARPLLPSPPTAYSRVGILEPGATSSVPTRSLPEYVQWKNPDSTSHESTNVKYDAEKLVPEKSVKQKSNYSMHRQFDCKLLKED